MIKKAAKNQKSCTVDRYDLARLKNGLRVLSIWMPDRESASVGIWVKAGSRYEEASISGTAHFLEHMMFKGTPSRSGRRIRQEIEGIGGILNAFTGEEVTCYFAKMLSRHLPVAMDVLADLIQNAVISAEEMAKEKSVILDEIKMYRDLPAHYIHDAMGEMLWPKHPLGRPISGSVESVSSINREILNDFRKRHYHLSNMLITVAGPLDHEKVFSRVENLFRSVRMEGRKESFLKAKAVQKEPQTLFIEKQTEQTHVVMGFRTFSRFHPDRYKLALLNVILGANMSSRLFEVVREKHALAYDIRSGANFYHDAGYLTVSAGVESEKTHQAICVILDQLRLIAKKGVLPAELKRAKDFFMSQLAMALEDTLDHMLWVGERMMDSEKLPDSERIRHSLESVTLEDLQKVARHVFRNDNMNLALIGPLTPSAKNKIQKDFVMSL